MKKLLIVFVVLIGLIGCSSGGMPGDPKLIAIDIEVDSTSVLGDTVIAHGVLTYDDGSTNTKDYSVKVDTVGTHSISVTDDGVTSNSIDVTFDIDFRNTTWYDADGILRDADVDTFLHFSSDFDRTDVINISDNDDSYYYLYSDFETMEDENGRQIAQPFTAGAESDYFYYYDSVNDKIEHVTTPYHMDVVNAINFIKDDNGIYSQKVDNKIGNFTLGCGYNVKFNTVDFDGDGNVDVDENGVAINHIITIFYNIKYTTFDYIDIEVYYTSDTAPALSVNDSRNGIYNNPIETKKLPYMFYKDDGSAYTHVSTYDDVGTVFPVDFNYTEGGVTLRFERK